MHFEALDGWYAAAGLAWLGIAASAVRDLRGVPTLPASTDGTAAGRPSSTTSRAGRIEPLFDALESREELPRVAVVIPCRDEAARIEGTLRRLLEQRGVELEIVVVDDRSSDGTGDVARDAAAGDPRVEVLRVDRLPEGWLGKTHALELGGSRVSAEWILFTDGDVWMEPDVLARAVATAHASGADHVVLAPDCPQRTFASRAALAMFSLALLRPMRAANADRRGWRAGVGIGAFNLVRASAWRAIGGHRLLALEVVDDVELGRSLARAGFRTRAFLAVRDVRADWGGTAPLVVRALEKNAFAELGYSSALAFGVVLATLALVALPLHGLASASPAGIASCVAMHTIGVPAWIVARRAGRVEPAAVLAWFGALVLAAATARSAWISLRQGGVRWRGTLHSLTELRAARRLRSRRG